MLHKVAKNVSKSLLGEAHIKDKQMIEVLQQFNHAYNNNVEKIRGTIAK